MSPTLQCILNQPVLDDQAYGTVPGAIFNELQREWQIQKQRADMAEKKRSERFCRCHSFNCAVKDGYIKQTVYMGLINAAYYTPAPGDEMRLDGLQHLEACQRYAKNAVGRFDWTLVFTSQQEVLINYCPWCRKSLTGSESEERIRKTQGAEYPV